MGMLGTKWRVWPYMSFFPIEKDFISIGKLTLILLIQFNSLQVPSTFGESLE